MVVRDPSNPLANLRFADDVLLLAGCKKDVARMIADLEAEARKYGLKMHMGKTVVLTNACARPNSIRCAGHDVRALQQGESEKYLGRKLSLDDFHNTELTNRLAAGWAS